MPASHHIFDRRLLTARRNRAAAQAEAHEFLLAAVADDLIERLQAIQRSFRVVLDLGAHHGLLGRRLRRLAGVETVIDADPAALLLAQCGNPRVQADEEALPFKDQSLDLVTSALALQFVNDLPGTLIQIRRALRPDGLLLAALLGGSTLHELRSAWCWRRRRSKAEQARALPPSPTFATSAACCSAPNSPCRWSMPTPSRRPIRTRLP